MSAIISKCKKYRYELERAIDTFNIKSAVAFVMLNPSTADFTVDDPTIRRCIRFAEDWAHTHLVVVNLYALRSTNPKGLWTHIDPVGPENNAYLTKIAKEYETVVCAWGANAKLDRVAQVAKIFTDAGCRMLCLGVTKSGAPRHPLYVKADTQLIEWCQP